MKTVFLFLFGWGVGGFGVGCGNFGTGAGDILVQRCDIVPPPLPNPLIPPFLSSFVTYVTAIALAQYYYSARATLGQHISSDRTYNDTVSSRVQFLSNNVGEDEAKD